MVQENLRSTAALRGPPSKGPRWARSTHRATRASPTGARQPGVPSVRRRPHRLGQQAARAAHLTSPSPPPRTPASATPSRSPSRAAWTDALPPSGAPRAAPSAPDPPSRSRSHAKGKLSPRTRAPRALSGRGPAPLACVSPRRRSAPSTSTRGDPASAAPSDPPPRCAGSRPPIPRSTGPKASSSRSSASGPAPSICSSPMETTPPPRRRPSASFLPSTCPSIHARGRRLRRLARPPQAPTAATSGSRVERPRPQALHLVRVPDVSHTRLTLARSLAGGEARARRLLDRDGGSSPATSISGAPRWDRSRPSGGSIVSRRRARAEGDAPARGGAARDAAGVGPEGEALFEEQVTASAIVVAGGGDRVCVEAVEAALRGGEVVLRAAGAAQDGVERGERGRDGARRMRGGRDGVVSPTPVMPGEPSPEDGALVLNPRRRLVRRRRGGDLYEVAVVAPVRGEQLRMTRIAGPRARGLRDRGADRGADEEGACAGSATGIVGASSTSACSSPRRRPPARVRFRCPVEDAPVAPSPSRVVGAAAGQPTLRYLDDPRPPDEALRTEADAVAARRPGGAAGGEPVRRGARGHSSNAGAEAPGVILGRRGRSARRFPQAGAGRGAADLLPDGVVARLGAWGARGSGGRRDGGGGIARRSARRRGRGSGREDQAILPVDPPGPARGASPVLP